MDMDMAGGFAWGTAPYSVRVYVDSPKKRCSEQRACGVVLWQAAGRRGQLARVGWVPAEVQEDEVGHVGRSEAAGRHRRWQEAEVQGEAMCGDSNARRDSALLVVSGSVFDWRELAKYKSSMRRRAGCCNDL